MVYLPNQKRANNKLIVRISIFYPYREYLVFNKVVLSERVVRSNNIITQKAEPTCILVRYNFPMY